MWNEFSLIASSNCLGAWFLQGLSLMYIYIYKKVYTYWNIVMSFTRHNVWFGQFYHLFIKVNYRIIPPTTYILLIIFFNIFYNKFHVINNLAKPRSKVLRVDVSRHRFRLFCMIGKYIHSNNCEKIRAKWISYANQLFFNALGFSKICPSY